MAKQICFCKQKVLSFVLMEAMEVVFRILLGRPFKSLAA